VSQNKQGRPRGNRREVHVPGGPGKATVGHVLSDLPKPKGGRKKLRKQGLKTVA